MHLGYGDMINIAQESSSGGNFKNLTKLLAGKPGLRTVSLRKMSWRSDCYSPRSLPFTAREVHHKESKGIGLSLLGTASLVLYN
jgi:hypothetical protein